MNLLREYIRELLVEQEEEQTELDKITDIFVNNGAQAVELGEMLLPDAREVMMMKGAVMKVREFLELFPGPHGAPTEPAVYDQRLRARDSFDHAMYLLLRAAIPASRWHGEHERLLGKFEVLSEIYKRLDFIILGNRLDEKLPHIEWAAEWAGVPMPKIPEGWPK